MTVSYTHLDVYKRQTSGYVSGDADNDGALDLTEVWIFEHTGVAVEGQYANVAAVTAQAADNANQPIAALGTFADDDPSHYWGCLLYTSRCV